MHAKTDANGASQLSFSRISAADLPQIDALLEMAADFFGTEQQPSQVPAVTATFDKLMALGPYNIGLQKNGDGQIVGWCTVFPTTTVLMRNFLSRSMTEKEMFDRTNIGDAGAVYVMSVFISPACRGKINPARLVVNTLKPLAQNEVAIFYEGLTLAGARLGTLLQKKFGNGQQQIFVLE